MNIVFTGHRDRLAAESMLYNIMKTYPNSQWIHGGACGFDEQVATFATAHQIPQRVVRPDYRQGRGAPLIRNRQMVNDADLVVACYDGRPAGGTAYTLEYAKRQSRPILILNPQ